MTTTPPPHGRRTMNAIERVPMIEDRNDSLYRICETEPTYGPRGGYIGERFVYWPDAYLTKDQARNAIKVVAAGGTNPQPSIKVDMDSGDLMFKESH